MHISSPAGCHNVCVAGAHTKTQPCMPCVHTEVSRELMPLASLWNALLCQANHCIGYAAFHALACTKCPRPAKSLLAALELESLPVVHQHSLKAALVDKRDGAVVTPFDSHCHCRRHLSALAEGQRHKLQTMSTTRHGTGKGSGQHCFRKSR